MSGEGVPVAAREPRRPELLSFSQAQRVGALLHDRWGAIAGQVPLTRDDMAWGDIVQFVLRMADDIVTGERQ